jgi:hypothetical protein
MLHFACNPNILFLKIWLIKEICAVYDEQLITFSFKQDVQLSLEDHWGSYPIDTTEYFRENNVTGADSLPVTPIWCSVFSHPVFLG